MPKGAGFVEFPAFEAGYEALKRATGGFRDVTPAKVAPIVFETPIALIVLRCMLGFTPPEWACYASRHTGVAITQGAARTIDRNIRMKPEAALPKNGGVTEQRINALVAAACHILESGAPAVSPDRLHGFDKADTRAGLASLQSLADLGAPYFILLYERLREGRLVDVVAILLADQPEGPDAGGGSLRLRIFAPDAALLIRSTEGWVDLVDVPRIAMVHPPDRPRFAPHAPGDRPRATLRARRGGAGSPAPRRGWFVCPRASGPGPARAPGHRAPRRAGPGGTARCPGRGGRSGCGG